MSFYTQPTRVLRSRTVRPSQFEDLLEDVDEITLEDDANFSRACKLSIETAKIKKSPSAAATKKAEAAIIRKLLPVFRRADQFQKLGALCGKHLQYLASLNILTRSRQHCTAKGLRNELQDFANRYRFSDFEIVLHQLVEILERTGTQVSVSSSDSFRSQRNACLLVILLSTGLIFELYLQLNTHVDLKMMDFSRNILLDLYRLLRFLQKSNGQSEHVIQSVVLKILSTFHLNYDCTMYGPNKMKRAMEELGKTCLGAGSTDYKRSLLYGTLLTVLWEKDYLLVEKLFSRNGSLIRPVAVRALLQNRAMQLRSGFPSGAYAVADLLHQSRGIHRSVLSFDIRSLILYQSASENLGHEISRLGADDGEWRLSFAPHPTEKIFFQIPVSSMNAVLTEVGFDSIVCVEGELESANLFVLNLELHRGLRTYVTTDVRDVENTGFPKVDSLEFRLSIPSGDVLVLLDNALARSFGDRMTDTRFSYKYSRYRTAPKELGQKNVGDIPGKFIGFRNRLEEAEFFKEVGKDAMRDFYFTPPLVACFHC